MESLLIWGLVLFGISFLLMVIELFVPTGGALGITAAAIAIAGVVCLFQYDASWGVVSLLTVMVIGPALAAFGLRIWPDTPMGRRIIGVPSEEELARQHEEQERERQRTLALIGKEGTVLTDLRPVGTVQIGDTRFDALSETHFVPTGARVRVTHVEGAQVKVRQVS